MAFGNFKVDVTYVVRKHCTVFLHRQVLASIQVSLPGGSYDSVQVVQLAVSSQ